MHIIAAVRGVVSLTLLPDFVKWQTVRKWNGFTGEELAVFKGHTERITCMEYESPILFTGSADKTIRIWDSDTGEPIRIYRHHIEDITCIRPYKGTFFSGAGEKFAYCTPIMYKGMKCCTFDHPALPDGRRRDMKKKHHGAKHGVFVMEVTSGSPAAAAGILTYDLVVECAGTRVVTILDMLQRMGFKDDEKIELKISRQNHNIQAVKDGAGPLKVLCNITTACGWEKPGEDAAPSFKDL